MHELIDEIEKYNLARRICRTLRWSTYNAVIASIMEQCSVSEEDAQDYYEDAMEVIGYEEENGL